MEAKQTEFPEKFPITIIFCIWAFTIHVHDTNGISSHIYGDI